jgi:hypothetical protein
MRRFLARFSKPVRSVHAQSWADFTITTFGFKFSVHTGMIVRRRGIFGTLILQDNAEQDFESGQAVARRRRYQVPVSIGRLSP